ncbi:hypothetical protein CWI38_0873p0020 [Hamiltosporidium tvaerminnensis]|uniref:Reverse transcriptase n=1 Tax=Hamiltosporidium tvaerminnensis TaxID=1176355 RepID=A0A4Q9LWF0_9MICR|nr:hypothetical protein CWI38_0873p0020 [Hamiltosporidium tvaerminnensis]
MFLVAKSVEDAQLAKLYNEIEKRKLHSKLYNARGNELVSVNDSYRWLKKGNIRLHDETVFCYIQDRNVFWGADGLCQRCNKSGKAVDHIATRCEKMLGHDYNRRHTEVARCLHILLLNRYKFKSLKRIGSHSVQEILDNEYAEIRVDTRIKTAIKIRNNRPDIFILDKKKNKITLIEFLFYKFSADIIPYVMTWDGIAYIQSIVLKKTVETISIDRRRGLEELGKASMGVIMRSEMHEESTPPLKEEKREEDDAKNLKTENITLLLQK